jgi:hypothetical protein
VSAAPRVAPARRRPHRRGEEAAVLAARRWLRAPPPPGPALLFPRSPPVPSQSAPQSAMRGLSRGQQRRSGGGGWAWAVGGPRPGR